MNKCCPEQLRPASEREERLEFLGNPGSHQETFDFSRVASALGGNALDDINNEVPDLATWQRDYGVTTGIAPTVRHRGKRPVNPNPGNPRMDPFCENTREPSVDGKGVKMPGWLTKGLKKHGGPKSPKKFLGKVKGNIFGMNPKLPLKFPCPCLRQKGE